MYINATFIKQEEVKGKVTLYLNTTSWKRIEAWR
jgi:hypothetical protein